MNKTNYCGNIASETAFAARASRLVVHLAKLCAAGGIKNAFGSGYPGGQPRRTKLFIKTKKLTLRF